MGKAVAIIQARMDSERMPGKVILPFLGRPVIEIIFQRVKQCQEIDEVIVATSVEQKDDALAEVCEEKRIPCFRGNLHNVLERFYDCADYAKAEVIIRLTGDNPFADGSVIAEGMRYFHTHDLDYIYYREGLPLGVGVEIFSFSALKKAYEKAVNSDCLEHVTPYIYQNPSVFAVERVKRREDEDDSRIRLTMDTDKDRMLVRQIFEHFGSISVPYQEVVRLLKDNQDLQNINQGVVQKSISYKGEHLERAS